MANLRDIRKRISSVKSTQKITKAMKMVAASYLRRYQDRFNSITRCQKNLQRLLGTMAVDHPYLLERTEGKRLSVLLSSDRGLCGGFNTNLMKFARTFFASIDEPYEVFTIGRKAREFCRRTNRPTVGDYDLSRLQKGDLTELFETFERSFLDGTYRSVELLYNEFRSVVSQRPVHVRLYPFQLETGNEGQGVDYLYEPDKERVLGQLLSYYAYLALYRCSSESLAAEYAARMAAMESATKNCAEMIDRLTLYYNRSRQAAITKELIEIISGAEAAG